jgi:hypothetical protein
VTYINGLSMYLYLSIYGSTAILDLGHFFSFVKQSVELLGRGISPWQGRYPHTEQHKQNKRKQASMFRVGFKPTIPVFEWAKTVHALDCAATVIGQCHCLVARHLIKHDAINGHEVNAVII